MTVHIPFTVNPFETVGPPQSQHTNRQTTAPTITAAHADTRGRSTFLLAAPQMILLNVKRSCKKKDRKNIKSY